VPISFTCTCGKRMKAPDHLAGKKVKCATCKNITMVPYPSCDLDETRLALLRPFMATGDPSDPDGFPVGCISKRTVVYACGAMGREGDTVEHTHSPAETELCRRLAADAAKVASGLDLSPGTKAVPFFVAANKGDKIVRNISEDFLRKKFGGVISPKCPCLIEPLREKGPWWETVLKDSAGNEAKLTTWRKLIEWFKAQREFQEAAFVRIGPSPQAGDFPRLALGFTNDGSLTGILG
jgi:hypothetical protein